MEFRILGPLEVAADGAPIMVGPAKQRALLGVLLLYANEVVSSERLIDELWGARPPPTAAKLVQVYVSQLRKALGAARGGEVLRTRAPGYVAVLEAEQLDAAQFVRSLGEARAQARGGPERAAAIYAAALALWRGAVLADLSFESQARVEVERLAELRLAAIGERIDCELVCGRHAQLIGELESLTSQQPLHERFWAQLMLVLYRSGRQSDALHAYQRARRTLVDQVGVEPGPELQRLEKAILTQDSSLDGAERLRNAVPPPSAVAPASTPAAAARRGLDRRRIALVVLFVGAVAAAAATLALTRNAGSAPLATIEPDSIGIVDPRENALVADVPLHTKPAAIAYGAGALWVATERDETLLKIEPDTRRVTRTIGLGAAPTALAIGGRNVWVLCGSGKTLLQFNGHTGQLVRKVAVAGRIRVGAFKGQRLPTQGLTVPDPFALTAGAGAAWIGYGGDVVTRVDAQTGAVQQIASGSARGVAVGAGAVWSVSAFSRTVGGFGVPDVAEGIWRIDPNTRTATEMIHAPDVVGGLGDGLVAGAEALWMINGVFRTVLKIDARSPRVTAVIPLQRVRHDLMNLRRQRRPTAVAVGAGAVWTVNADATVSRIEPHTAAVARTIPLGRHPRIASPVGVATGGGLVWVAVH